MARSGLNLADRPFSNRRPVRRAALILWVSGSLLFALDVWLYWDFIAGREATYEQLARVEESIATEERRLDALSEEVARFDLAAQNAQVEFLNQRIAQRRFSWSDLFDELSALLPDDVRLVRLSPQMGDEGRRRTGRSNRSRGAEPGKVPLAIEGVARSSESILELVDALFADPSFEAPRLNAEQRDDSGLVRFTLDTLYDIPEPPAAEMVEVPSAETETTADDADAGALAATAPAALGRPASSPPELAR